MEGETSQAGSQDASTDGFHVFCGGLLQRISKAVSAGPFTLLFVLDNRMSCAAIFDIGDDDLGRPEQGRWITSSSAR